MILWKGVDENSIDGSVDGTGRRARDLGGVLRHLQSGSIRNYATWVLTGSLLVILIHRVRGRDAMSMLLIVLFLPLIGFFLLLALPKNSTAASPLARAISLLTFVLSLGLIGAVYKSPIAFSNVIDIPWVDLGRHSLPSGCRRNQPMAHRADHAAGSGRGLDLAGTHCRSA